MARLLRCAPLTNFQSPRHVNRRERRAARPPPADRGGRITTMTEVTGPGRQAGLRERKKAKTRAAIREHAIRLFREQGYDGPTVEQIAAAAELSPRSEERRVGKEGRSGWLPSP